MAPRWTEMALAGSLSSQLCYVATISVAALCAYLERIDMGTTENAIEIVRATVDDLPSLAPLFDGYRQFYKQAPDLEGARRFLAAHFEHDTSVIFLALNR